MKLVIMRHILRLKKEILDGEFQLEHGNKNKKPHNALTDDEIEKIGVERAKERFQRAGLVFMVLDGGEKISEDDKELLTLCKDKRSIVIINKSDLNRAFSIDEIKDFDMFEAMTGAIREQTAKLVLTVRVKQNDEVKREKVAEEISTGDNKGNTVRGKGVVIPGFYGLMPDGTIRTFSRGGSDITGALAAAALDAEVYENWTDVSGILMADPRIVDDPMTIPQVTYDELRELSYSGAQVLHEDSIFPVREKTIPVVVVPTSFNTVTEEEFKARGVNVVIYANQLTRTGFPAMQNAARLILENHRAKECDDICMSIKDIINLIPEE